jgi:hypothetical protein
MFVQEVLQPLFNALEALSLTGIPRWVQQKVFVFNQIIHALVIMYILA